jgi:hypothetical protein
MNIMQWLRGRQESPQSRKFLADDARQLLENPLFQYAFSSVGEHLEGVALSCNPDDKDKAARIITSKQLLAALKREVEALVEDGDMAEIELAELEARKKPLRFSRG